MNQDIDLKKKSAKKNNLIINFVYIFFITFFIFKMFFYGSLIGSFPDEPAHISYIAYLEETGRIIPEFAEMKMLNIEGSSAVWTDNTNYLFHPPLYYHIMRLARGVSVNPSGEIAINFDALRNFTIFFSTINLVIIMYIGRSRLKSTFGHLIYACSVTSLPMLAYNSAGINNDTLSLTGFSLFFLGMIRLYEKQENYLTYILISIGVFMSFLSKLTLGLFLTVFFVLLIIYIVFKYKKIMYFNSKYFLATLPVYLLTAAYFVYVRWQTGSFQPTLLTVAPAEYYASGFYVEESLRTEYGRREYFEYYWRSFRQSWTGISSHFKLLKARLVDEFSFILLGLLPVVFVKDLRKKPENALLFKLFVALVFVIGMQFVRAYNGYLDNGYLGGYQSRYYLCIIPLLAYSMGVFVSDNMQNKYGNIRRKLTAAFAVAVSIHMICNDLIYFIRFYHLY